MRRATGRTTSTPGRTTPAGRATAATGPSPPATPATRVTTRRTPFPASSSSRTTRPLDPVVVADGGEVAAGFCRFVVVPEAGSEVADGGEGPIGAPSGASTSNS